MVHTSNCSKASPPPSPFFSGLSDQTSTGPRRAYPQFATVFLFCLIVAATVIGVPLFGYLYGYNRLDWMMFGLLYVVTGLGITVGYHRLISHRSFACPGWVKAGLLIAGGWALQNSALKWGADHIRHHAACDQEADPYNATRGFWYSHCGWLLVGQRYTDEKYAVRLRQDPIVMWQHRYYVPIVLSGLALPFLAGFLYGGWRGGLSCFMLAGIGRTFAVLNSTFCINSICHIWGRQPHSQTDSSRDSWLVSLLTFGEGYHNYHHTYPSDYRNGPRWYNFDPSKWLIATLAFLGLAWSLRTAGDPAAKGSGLRPASGG
ncbi:MAG: fatty acid desaturase [Nitrospira sp.]|nr:fatty acid desaturase [Nitrospira sp.]